MIIPLAVYPLMLSLFFCAASACPGLQQMELERADAKERQRLRDLEIEAERKAEVKREEEVARLEQQAIAVSAALGGQRAILACWPPPSSHP